MFTRVDGTIISVLTFDKVGCDISAEECKPSNIKLTVKSIEGSRFRSMVYLVMARHQRGLKTMNEGH